MNAQQPLKPSALSLLIGTWNTRGTTANSPSEPIIATDRYEWMSGEFFLLHRVDSQRPQAFTALEIIGPKAADDSYPIAGFDSNGGAYRSICELDDRVFRIVALHERFSGEFSNDGQMLIGHWERSADGQAW